MRIFTVVTKSVGIVTFLHIFVFRMKNVTKDMNLFGFSGVISGKAFCKKAPQSAFQQLHKKTDILFCGCL
jgi:hypothetical protein